jgi:hypothetical protein
MTDTIEGQQGKLGKDSADKQKAVRDATDNSKLADSLKNDIDQAANKKKQSVDNYGAKYPTLQQRWQQQDTQLSRLKADIIAVFPDYVDRINSRVCNILTAIGTQQGKVDAFAPHQGTNEKAVAQAKRAADAAKATLDAWLGGEAALANRLNDIDKAIKNVQSVFGGADQVYSIYLLWFKAFPPHQEIAPRAGGAGGGGGAAAAPACLPKPDPNAVYLIAPAKYAGQLDAAWDDYRLKRLALKTATDSFNDAPDDLASETKTLKQKLGSQDDDVKKSLES